MIKTGHYVHFQWTGSNTNPNNNAGQGRAGSDRHNVLASRMANYFENQPQPSISQLPTYGQWGTSYPMKIPSVAQDGLQAANINWNFLGFSRADLQSLATTEQPGGHFGGELSELDDAGTYFDLGPRRVTKNGIYNYLCTRNNNFSNRSQKGKIVVSETEIAAAAIGWNGGSFTSGSANLYVAQGALLGLTTFTMTSTPASATNADFSEPASDFVTVLPIQFTSSQGMVRVRITFKANPLLSKVSVHRADTMNGTFESVGGLHFPSSGVVEFNTDKGGVFVVRDKTDVGAIVGIAIGALVVAAILGFLAYRWHSKRSSGSSAPAKAPAKAPAAATTKVEGAPAAAGKRELPPGWTAITDPKDGATYYSDPLGNTQWEFPES